MSTLEYTIPHKHTPCRVFAYKIYRWYRKIAILDYTQRKVKFTFDIDIYKNIDKKYKCLNYYIKPIWYWSISKEYITKYKLHHPYNFVIIKPFKHINDIIPI